MFKLTPDGLELVEVAPGIDIERDILARMEFRPIVRNPAMMDQRIFANGPMGLRDQLLRMPIEQRFTYHPGENRFFVNLEGHRVRSHEDVEEIRRIVETKLAPLGRKVYAVVNYDSFEIFPDIIDEYSAMVDDLVDRFYSGVTRYTTSSFLRAKLGDALKQRALAPHIYESAEEASHPPARPGTEESRLTAMFTTSIARITPILSIGALPSSGAIVHLDVVGGLDYRPPFCDFGLLPGA